MHIALQLHYQLKALLKPLGKQTANNLDLLRVGPPPSVNFISEHQQALQQLLHKFNDRFTGLEQLKDVEVQIKVNPSITPITQKPRRLPILLQKQVDQELDRLLQLGVLEKVDTPPTWVNPLHVAAKKNGGIRICVDMKKANTAIIREPYQIPTLEEFRHEFNGCTIFSTLDLNQGYHQLTLLHENSRDLTAFAARKGILRYTRLIFGMAPASEICQREIERILY